MRSFKEISEKRGDTCVFTFGRFNPPTTGHEKLIEACGKEQKKNAGSKMYVYPSHSNDPKKNPLKHSKKIAYMRAMFPKYKKDIVASKARNVFEVATELHNKGHRAIVMVVGSDRVQEFEKLLNQYNGVEGRHGYYGFDNIMVKSAGERDPDAEGVEGMSASKMRAAAADGDFDSFKQGLPLNFKDGKKLYRDVRAGMGIREERMMGDMNDIEFLRDLYLTGKIWNAGDIIETNKGIEGEIIRKGTNYLTIVEESGKVHKVWLHDITERNYKKEYANYHGTPEQIARRSSRNKARRIMGDKTKIGMDVGHKDNNPLNNDPSNLRNEDPSKNRREPRLREGAEEIKKLEKMLKDLEKKRKKTPGDGFAKMRIKELIADLKSKKEEVDEGIIDQIPWLRKALQTIHRLEHPKGYEKLVKQYVDGMKDKDHRDHPSMWASDIARQYRGVDAREFVAYINKLVSKGKLPRELRAEYIPESREDWSFKDFVKQINEAGNKADWPKKAYDKYKEKFPKVDDDEDGLDEAKIAALVKKAEGSKYTYGTLKKVYDRGMGAYKTNPGSVRPNVTSPQQWALARVNSFLKGGHKQDDDLKEADGPCWDGYKQVGMKKKNGKDVPNCVPEETDLKEVLGANADQGDYIKDFEKSDAPQFKGKSKEKRKEMAIAAYKQRNEWGEITEKAEYDGKSVDLNNPTKGDTKKYKVYVKNEKGNVVKVEFGDPNMEIKRDDPKNRASFRARHGCDNPGPKWKARYWSCKFWSSKSVTDLMKG